MTRGAFSYPAEDMESYEDPHGIIVFGGTSDLSSAPVFNDGPLRVSGTTVGVGDDPDIYKVRIA